MFYQLVAFQLYQMLITNAAAQAAVLNGFGEALVPGTYHFFAAGLLE
jgi:hypothetical protein